MAKKELNVVEILNKEIEKLETKKNKVYFYVVDSKASPVGLLSYEYDIALQLKKLGYNVAMLHNEKEFVGVADWLGKEYVELKHYQIEKDNVLMAPSDILIIPEVCAGVMAQTKGLSCRRIALLHSLAFLTDSVTLGTGWADLRINECIVSTPLLERKVKEYFPFVKTHVIRPSIPDFFFEAPKAPKQLVINVIVKDTTDINRILKPFYWKYPAYAWVAFRPINRNLTREAFADALKESFATIWVDDFTDFGYSAVEALACKNVIVGKVPENAPEWIVDGNGKLSDTGLWFYNSYDAADAIASVIQSFITNNIPQEVFDEGEKVVKNYTTELQKIDIQEEFEKKIIPNKISELRLAITVQQKDEENNKKKDNK